MMSKEAQRGKALMSHGDRKKPTDVDQILTLLQDNQFILVSGKAGTGKSFLLRQVREALMSVPNLRVTVAAPTGVAAVNAGGTTLHTWLGMGLAEGDIEELKQSLTLRAKVSLGTTDVLMIDEISMAHPKFFNTIGLLAQHVQKKKKPFGSMKVIMFGDFLQLPPVVKKQNVSKDLKFVFQTKIWQEMNVYRVTLTKVHRQKDKLFLRVLEDVRSGKLSQETVKILENRCIATTQIKHGLPFTRLCTFRNQVEAYNKRQLEMLGGEATSYKGFFKYKSRRQDGTMSGPDLSIAKRLIGTAGRMFPVPVALGLKHSAQVMMRCNKYIKQNVYNGSVGCITKLGKDEIVVKFGQDVTIGVRRHTFVLQAGSSVDVCFQQFPLCLSYAITIHKSQGLTLGRVLVDTDCFEDGQLYTALSRVRCLDGLHLKSFEKKGLKFDCNALRFENYRVE